MLKRLITGRLVTAVLVVSAVVSSSLVMAQEKSSRPTVGLVLGGGGAKGAAHVGVLKALEDMKIPVDYIAGTSMGAYVGGLYAAGMSAGEIEAMMESIDWNAGYQDRVYRGDRRVREKAHEDKYNISTNLGFDFKSLKTPQGIVQGQNMIRILRDSTGNMPAFSTFDNLVIPFRAVATDIEQLVPVVIGDGQLTEAMLASMSVPGALPPVELNGAYLVDGGAVNNMPVDVAKALGADVVIAVDISTDYSPAEELGSYLSVMNQLVNFMVRNSTRQQIANMTAHDVLLTPDVGDMETTEFARMPEALDEGYSIALQSKEQLAGLMMTSGEYQEYIEKKQLRRRTLRYGDQMAVDRIILNNDTSFADEVLEKRLALEPGQMDSKLLEQSVQNLYALDRFETVRYHLESIGKETVLVVDVKEKSWGPNFIDFRFAIEDNFDSQTDMSVGLSINTTGISDYGAELRTTIEGGNDRLVQSELYLPYTADQQFFTTIRGAYEVRDRVSFGGEPTIENSGIRANVRRSEWQGEISFGWQPQLWSEFKVGYQYVDGHEEFLGNFNETAYTRSIPYVSVTLDTLDNHVFPSSGSFFETSFGFNRDTAMNETAGATSEEQKTHSTQFDIEALHASSWGKHTVYGKLRYGELHHEIDGFVIAPKELGGFLNLSGVPKNSLSGNNLAFGAMVYRYRLLDNDFGLFQSPVYLGASLEYGGVWNDPDFSLKNVPFYAAGSIFAGIDSPLGPIIAAYGRTESDHDSVYLIIGSPF